jgi:hypothetical protein
MSIPCHFLSVITLNVMLSVVMLCVFMLSVIMLRVVTLSVMEQSFSIGGPRFELENVQELYFYCKKHIKIFLTQRD